MDSNNSNKKILIMKIELQSGDRITIPEGCKATVSGNEVVIEEKNIPHVFRDGDIIIDDETKCSNDWAIAILRGDFNDEGFQDYASIDYDGGFDIAGTWDVKPDSWRLATEEEKQFLFDKMKERGLRWNAEEKRVEKIRWRAKNGEFYYHTMSNGDIRNWKEESSKLDDKRFNMGNYFQTVKQAETAAKEIQKALLILHKQKF